MCTFTTATIKAAGINYAGQEALLRAQHIVSKVCVWPDAGVTAIFRTQAKTTVGSNCSVLQCGMARQQIMLGAAVAAAGATILVVVLRQLRLTLLLLCWLATLGMHAASCDSTKSWDNETATMICCGSSTFLSTSLLVVLLPTCVFTQNYKNKEDETANSGLVVPLLPFGMPKYDAGERFDLRSPYADDGWVDPEETGAGTAQHLPCCCVGVQKRL